MLLKNRLNGSQAKGDSQTPTHLPTYGPNFFRGVADNELFFCKLIHRLTYLRLSDLLRNEYAIDMRQFVSASNNEM